MATIMEKNCTFPRFDVNGCICQLLHIPIIIVVKFLSASLVSTISVLSENELMNRSLMQASATKG